METKSEYIDKLLSDLKILEGKISGIKASDSFSFTFFRDSFNKTQEIMRALHELEILHIEDMKKQMEKLVLFLSENERSKEKPVTNQPYIMTEEPDLPPVEPVEPDINYPEEKAVSEELPSTPTEPKRNIYAEGVTLPGYTNPRANEVKVTPESANGTEKPVIRSVNDIINPPPASLELKRSLSLNDRFLYQRELFNNDRHEMNSMMLKLNAFDNYEDTERYLREHTSWNFEEKIVKDFLAVLKEGFN